jgi:hypothetical protein
VVTVREIQQQNVSKVETKNLLLLLLAKFGPGLHAKMKVNEGIWVICTVESMGRD